MHSSAPFREYKGVDHLDLITKWDELGDYSNLEVEFDDILMLAELALVRGREDILGKIGPLLSDAESATLGLVQARLSGGELNELVESALQIATAPGSRDLTLEGRLRMERGLIRFESGDIEGAKDDLTWAETRLNSVAKASRLHDISLLNKAALHLSCGEGVMALETYGRISRHAGHANETIALSRMGAARIHAALGHRFDAVRNAWNAHTHALLAKDRRMAVEAGAIFVDLASIHQFEDAAPMREQVEQASPRSLEDPEPVIEVRPEDISGVFEWCLANLDEGVSGENRVDLRAMLQLAHRLDRMNDVEFIFVSKSSIEDPALLAMINSLNEEE